jgi:hypothetical protein
VLHKTVSKFHDADRVRRRTVIGDHALADPEVAASLDAADGEVAFGGMAAALRLDLGPVAEALAGLRIVEDRIGGVDRVLGIDVQSSGADGARKGTSQ